MFVSVLAQARHWGVAPWDLICPESKGMECWVVWMAWSSDLLAVQQKYLKHKADADAEVKAMQRTPRRRRRNR